MASPSLSKAQTDAFDRILSEAVSSKSTGALFFGVTTADAAIYTHAVGTKLIDDPASGNIDEDTIAALQLIEQGKITLDTPVETVLRELADPVVVTGRDEAGHPTGTTPAKGKIIGLDYFHDGTSPPTGLPVAYSHSYKDEDVSAFFKILKSSFPGVLLSFEPRTGFGYGFSSDCAGFIVERLSGKSLEQYFQDHIFAPLGITSASFYLTPELKDRLLPLSYRTKSGVIERWNRPSVIDQDPAHVRVHLGGACAISLSLQKFNADHNETAAGCATNPILSRASVDSMFEPTLPPAGATSLNAIAGMFDPYLGLAPGSAGVQFSRGLCVAIDDVPGKLKRGAGAWSGWASTDFFMDPAMGVVAVFGTQLVPTGDDMHKHYILGRPRPTPWPRPSANLGQPWARPSRSRLVDFSFDLMPVLSHFPLTSLATGCWRRPNAVDGHCP
ncbi:beta-lactamase/transpeptidase-like protein [Mycena capillaripes]|nr:beta-lactamase/transpeptidase-like protein [Mycena capillaripes]